MFEFISVGIAALLLFIGIVVLANKKARATISMLPLFKGQTWGIVFVAVGLIFGGVGYYQNVFSDATASIAGDGVDDVESVTGLITVQLSDGWENNVTTTSGDYYEDSGDSMRLLTTDGWTADGAEFGFNVTIERSLTAEDANLRLSCNIADKELSGVTADNLAEKTGGEIDLDYVGATSTGHHSDDNTVWTYVSMSEGTGSDVIGIKFDQEETYHDGMTDYDDYVDVLCDVEGTPFSARIYAIA